MLAAAANNILFRRAGLELIDRKQAPAWVTLDYEFPMGNRSYDPKLTSDNPKLVDLEARYAAFDPVVTTPLIWRNNVISEIDLQAFRGSKAYLSQVRSTNNPISYVATYYYTRTIDHRGLLDKIVEPGDFGVYAQEVDGKKVSRDQLDTIQELYFLDRHLGLFDRSKLSVLDIGAGYGRLGAHLATAFHGELDYACTDAVALSSFLCDYYVRSRDVSSRVRMLPLDRLSDDQTKPDLALNIHSFPECRLEAVGWWIERLRDKGAPYLFVVPNPIDTVGRTLKNGLGEDFRPVIEERGFKLEVCEPKYLDPSMQEHGISPTHYYLFRNVQA